MPCSVSQEEIDDCRRARQAEYRRDGRWDLLATKAQLSGWLCDVLRGESPSTEVARWFIAHETNNDL